ncbi:MAG: hypothetical protein KF778_22715 [Rhodocyclaceae bacterium]|nr:hypothetical protein [Rhodocyclaceae bacterium]
MSTAVGSLEQLAGEFARVFEPLVQRAETDTLDEVLPWLGLRVFEMEPDTTALTDALTAMATAAAELDPLINDLAQAVAQDDRAAIASTAAALLQQLRATLQGIEGVVRALQTLGNDATLSPQHKTELAAFARLFPERLLHRLVADYFEVRFPQVALLLLGTGAIEAVDEPGLPEGSLQGPYVRKTLHLNRLLQLFTDPTGLLRDVYGWGTPSFDGLTLFMMLQRLLNEKFGIPAEILHPAGEPALLEAFGFNAEVNPTFTPPGLDMTMRAPTSTERSDTIAEGAWQVTFDTIVRISSDLTASIRPPLDLDFQLPAGTAMDVTVGAQFVRTGDAEPFVVIGSAGGSRLAMQRLRASVKLDLHVDAAAPARATVDPTIAFAVERGELVIDFSNADGFLAKVFPKNGLAVPFDVAGEWSFRRGLSLQGGVGFEATLPLHVTLLNAISIELLRLAVRTSGGGNGQGIDIVAATSATLKLGPVTATIDQVGFAATLRLPPGGGNLGPLDLSLGFQPPTGLGLAVATAGVTGGGFLGFDPQRAEYSGMLQLELAETIAVKALGLLTTKLPDGSKGYSLVILVTAEGFTPIPVGLGFTLTGIGGLVALHRTVRTDVLRDGLKTGTLNSVLFPPDPLRNAPQIFSDLRRVFPPTAGRHVVGPMVQLRWGTPTLLTLDLALLVELPAPIRVVVLGRLQVLLPNQSHPLIQIRMDALGVLDVSAETVSLDATLYDSRILQFTLTGDMALRAGWGRQPQFVLAIGGFHPRFAPPPGLPALQRLALQLADGDSLQLRCQAYLAVTSNTVQFGARVDLHAAGGGFSFDGMLGFDAILQVAPLAFEVEVGAALALRYRGRLLLGVSFKGRLAGPTPWQVAGKASIKLLFFSVSVSFSRTFGSKTAPPLPAAVDVISLIAAALADRRNWSGAVPRSSSPVVTFRETAPPANGLRVHPWAELTLRERIAPLNRQITKLGTVPIIGGPTTVTVSLTDRAGAHPWRTTPVSEPFALAQYEDLREDEQLTQPAFIPLQGGLTVAANDLAMDDEAGLAAPIAYETLLLDPTRPPERPKPGYVLSAAVLARVAPFGAAGQAPARRRRRTPAVTT